MKKQSILVLLSCITILSFTACGAKDDKTDLETTPTPVVTEGTLTPEPTEEVTPTTEPTIEPTTIPVSLQNIYDAVKKAYGENYLPSMEIEASSIKELYNVDPKWYKEVIAEGPMISTHVDVFIGFEAEDGHADDIVNALTDYKNYLIKESLQYPMNQGKVENAAIVKNGNYVFFLMLGGYPENIEDKDMNNTAIQTIEAVIAGKAPSTTEDPDQSTSDEINLEKIHTQIKDAYGDRYLPDMKIDELALSEQYGLKSEWYDDVIAEYSAMRTHVDTFIAVKSKTENKKEVISAFETYKKYLMEEAIVYPMNSGKVASASIIEYGDYVFFFMLGGYSDDIDDLSEAEMIPLAEKDNQIAIDVLDKLLGDKK